MEGKITKQLELVERSNAWIKSSLETEKQKNAYRQMVNFRRKLNKKKSALEGNPAAAIYGESQVGKSYLISGLLSEEGKPFGITDENGDFHNFIEEVNPPGGGTESTSLVSRFSVNYKPMNPKFPIKAILLSPADILLVLCDSFYNDINHKTSQNFHFLSADEINTEVTQLKDKFKDRQSQQKVLGEDDVLDLKEYFEKYFQKADKVIDSNFFDEISLLITKTQPSEWKDVFSLLWNKNEIFTNLFNTLVSEYEKLNFSNEVYLPTKSVLYASGTLLDVKRLREIYTEPDKIEPEYTLETSVFLHANEQEVKFDKNYLCALTAELVFSQSETLLSSKPFLKDTDLLDFPGARSRMEKPIDTIENKTIPDLLLRGKVAYLFNKYSDDEKINILLFCAKHEQTAQRIMPRLLNNWISNVIGETPEKRGNFVAKSKISPLFVVATFFNINLQYDPLRDGRDKSSLDYRWLQRFATTMGKEYFEIQTYSWFEQWTNTKKDFQNIFLLRDFEKSETPSNIYKGFNENKRELEEVIPVNYSEFRSKLRQSFIEYPFVQRHFADPAESWDRAASINEDGTKLIIDKLSIAAANINKARHEKILAELNELAQSILLELQKYHHSADKDAELQKAKSIAGDIQLKLDIAFNGDGIKLFGLMMNELFIDEGSVYKLYRQKLDEIERRDVINMDKYSTIRINVVELDSNDPYDINLERLFHHYEKKTAEQKQQFLNELILKDIDLQELFYGNNDRIKNYSQQLTDSLLEFWLLYVTQHDKHILKQVLPESALQDILDMFQKLFKKLGINKIIAEKIRFYVDGFNKIESAYEMMADISAEILNKCINSVGMDLFSESDFYDLKQANKKNNLDLIFTNSEDYDTRKSREVVGDLFYTIDNLQTLVQEDPKSITNLPSYSNYQKWYNHLKIGFVSVCDIPNYDIQENERLGAIISECETIKY